MNIPKSLLALAVSVLAVPQAMACFTVYSRAGQPVYSGMEPPIDMSYQIHEKLPTAFPGGHMVFGMSTDCPAIDTRRVSPELTNVSLASSAVAVRRTVRTRPMTTAERNRQQDALQK
ncbi:MAG: hypothetical protein JWQ72_594 [Polaromonas sp.]|nr:hypothetical protein [Polaromonas sp.]